MYPFESNTDYLQLESHLTCEDEGLNYINIRKEWHNLDDIDRDDLFTSITSGLTVSGAWSIDGGDGSLTSGKRERRAFCRKGKASFSFTGTSIMVRVFAQPLYGQADVRIDGVLPSQLSGVTQALDVLSCDAYDIEETWGEEYLDIMLANNITDTTHTVELYAENTASGVGGWFCIAGYKVAEFANKTRDFDCNITQYKISANRELLSFVNALLIPDDGIPDDLKGWWYEGIVRNLEVIFGSYFVDAYGTQIGTANAEEIWPGCNSYIEFYPDVQGTESEHQESKTIQITAEYEDPDGAIHHTWEDYLTIAFQEEMFYKWGEWELSYDTGVAAQQSTAYGAYLKFNTFGTYVTIYYLYVRAWIPGILRIYVDDVPVGDLVCGSRDIDFYEVRNHTYDGLGNTTHTVKIENILSGQYGIWHAIEWSEVRRYTSIVETITYDYNLKHIPPFPPVGPRFESHNSRYPTCQPVNLDRYDYSIPRVNAGVDMLYLDKRVATYAVCYKSGFEKILKSYDIVIVEPKALTRDIVRGYQALGIKVICYCSYGEEIGTWENEWDSSSSLVPYTGDGTGVGGYASYYNKDGNQFGECSECKHDRRRLEGVTECALEQTSYYAAWAGRCSNACTRDWRTGYETYILGWNCGGGYNKNNNWNRTATKACTNSACPQYNAVKGACQYYESPDEAMYGQDYSVFTPDWPDENGIWKSFYTNPTQSSWSERLKQHYLTTIFEEAVQYTESVSVNTFQTNTTGITVDGFKVEHVPIDCDERIDVRHVGENHVYARGLDYIFDSETGIFKMQVQTTGAPSAPWGTNLEITYTRKGLEADGIFLDTLDTVDVYTSEEYRAAMVTMIGEHHELYSDKIWAMNRGFTILENLMPFTDYVMFETFVTSYNWDTGVYYEITDPAAIAANQVFIDQLFDLRATYKFNVLGLNYCGKDDDALRQLIAEKTRQYGWLSWSSEITLDNPQKNGEVFTKDLYIESDAWRLVRELPLP